MRSRSMDIHDGMLWFGCNPNVQAMWRCIASAYNSTPENRKRRSRSGGDDGGGGGSGSHSSILTLVGSYQITWPHTHACTHTHKHTHTDYFLKHSVKEHFLKNSEEEHVLLPRTSTMQQNCHSQSYKLVINTRWNSNWRCFCLRTLFNEILMFTMSVPFLYILQFLHVMFKATVTNRTLL